MMMMMMMTMTRTTNIYTEQAMCQKPLEASMDCSVSLILTATCLGDRQYYHPHFTNEETGGQDR